MSTLVWLDGFEHQIASGAGWTYQPNVYDTVPRAAGISFVTGRTAGSAAQIVEDGATITALVKSRAYTGGNLGWDQVLVGSFYFKIASAPSGNSNLFVASATVNAFLGMNTNGTVYGQISTGTKQSTSGTYNDNAWHRIDFRFNTSANGYTLDWQIDGSAQTQATFTSTAATITEFRFGSSTAGDTLTVIVDDAVFSGTTGDYPLGEHKVLSLLPNADGTHSLGGSGLAKSTGGTTDVWNVLDEIPPTIDDYLLQANVGTGNYLEFAFPNTSESNVQAARAIYTTASAGTAANAAETRITDGTTTFAVLSGDYSSTSAFFNASMVGSASAWTPSPTNLNALIGRFGFASDANPDPWLGGIMLEYAVASGTQTPQTVAVTATTTAAIARSIRKPVAASTPITAAFTRSTAKAVAVAVSVTAEVSRRTAKAIAVSAPITAVVTASKIVLQAIAATTTIGADLFRRTGKTVATSATLDPVTDATFQAGGEEYFVTVAIAGTPEGWVGT